MPTDRHAQYWRQSIGTGHAARAQIDTFLQNWLVRRERQPVSTKHLYDRLLKYARGTAETPTGALRSTVPSRIAESSRKKEARLIKGEAGRQSHTLFQERDRRAVLLKRPVAARFWGLGTRWCTTSSDEIFWRYARSAPLIVFVTPHGRYQLQVGEAFKDAADHDFERGVFKDAPVGFLSVVNDPHAAIERTR